MWGAGGGGVDNKIKTKIYAEAEDKEEKPVFVNCICWLLKRSTLGRGHTRST